MNGPPADFSERRGAGAPGEGPGIDREAVVHVASLARLELTPEEIDLFTGQLGSVLGHAADIASLDLTGVPPTAHPQPLANVLRADEPRAGLDRDDVLASAPQVAEHRFEVPRIQGEDPEAIRGEDPGAIRGDGTGTAGVDVR